MAINFPDSPTPGQIFQSYVWDGEKWLGASSAAAGSVVGAVRYDAAQALTSAQTSQARANVYAAPLDALAFNGMQVNGSGDVSQAGGGTSYALLSGTAMHSADSWKVWYNHGTAVFQTAVGSLSANGIPLSGYTNGIVLTATSPMTSPASGHYAIFRHVIEGYRTARLGFGTANAQPFSFGFWIYGQVTGGINIRISNSALNRSIIIEKQVTGGSWNWVTATVPGDVTGTWQATTLAGLYFDIIVAGNGPNTGPAGVWGSSNEYYTPNLSNQFSGAYAVVVTGLIIVPGNELPSQARAALIQRPFDQELLLCKRYYSKSWDYVTVPANSGFTFRHLGAAESTTTINSQRIYYPVEMRATPAMTFYCPSQGTPVNGQWQIFNGASFPNATATAVTTGGTSSFAVNLGGFTGLTFGLTYLTYGNWTADARL